MFFTIFDLIIKTSKNMKTKIYLLLFITTILIVTAYLYFVHHFYFNEILFVVFPIVITTFLYTKNNGKS